MGVRGPWGRPLGKAAASFAFPQVTHLQIGRGPLPWDVQASFHGTPGTSGSRTMARSSTTPPAVCREQISNLNYFSLRTSGPGPPCVPRAPTVHHPGAKRLLGRDVAKKEAFRGEGRTSGEGRRGGVTEAGVIRAWWRKQHQQCWGWGRVGSGAPPKCPS